MSASLFGLQGCMDRLADGRIVIDDHNSAWRGRIQGEGNRVVRDEFPELGPRDPVAASGDPVRLEFSGPDPLEDRHVRDVEQTGDVPGAQRLLVGHERRPR